MFLDPSLAEQIRCKQCWKISTNSTVFCPSKVGAALKYFLRVCDHWSEATENSENLVETFNSNVESGWKVMDKIVANHNQFSKLFLVSASTFHYHSGLKVQILNSNFDIWTGDENKSLVGFYHIWTLLADSFYFPQHSNADCSAGGWVVGASLSWETRRWWSLIIIIIRLCKCSRPGHRPAQQYFQMCVVRASLYHGLKYTCLQW